MNKKHHLIEAYVDTELKRGRVPRLSDVVEHTRLSRTLVRQVLLTLPAFQAVLPQQRPPGHGRRRRMISTPTLGYYHADIGFFAIQSRYPTPPKYRSGFLVLVDSLSRYVMIEILPFNRSSTTMLKAFERLVERHKAQHGFPLRGISFDQERSIVSRAVQAFFKEHRISFRDFMYSASKAKLAENTIGRIRALVSVLEATTGKTWWKLIKQVEDNLNHQPLILYGRAIKGMTPASVTEKNVSELVAQLEQQTPAFYFGHFDLNPDLIPFLYNVGQTVKVKTKVMSSQVLGPKRKIHQLSEETFVIVQRKAYVRLDMTVGKTYTVHDTRQSLPDARLHTFEEEEVVPVPSLSSV